MQVKKEREQSDSPTHLDKDKHGEDERHELEREAPKGFELEEDSNVRKQACFMKQKKPEDNNNIIKSERTKAKRNWGASDVSEPSTGTALAVAGSSGASPSLWERKCHQYT